MINDEAVYKSLLKINQIGKKITPQSDYLLTNGLIIGYSKQEMSDTETNPLSIGFIDKNIIKKLEGLGDNKGLKINGNLLYEYSKEYEFHSITDDENGININFVYYAVDDNAYIENFKNILRDNKFSEDEIKRAQGFNFTNDMDMYDLYLKYKKTTEPVQVKTINSIKLKYITTDNFIYKKSEKIINELNEYNLIYKEEIDREILDIIITAKQPVKRKLKINDNNIIKVRLMKSIFNPIASKNNAGISIYNKNNKYIMSARVDCTGVTLFNIYRILNY